MRRTDGRRTTSFPVAMRGYDRDAVAAHVKRLEDSIAQAHATAEQARKEAAQGAHRPRGRQQEPERD